MPVIVSDGLPALETLARENIAAFARSRASDLPGAGSKAAEADGGEPAAGAPLKLAILNLMPTKIATETQLLRLLALSPHLVDVHFFNTETHESKNTSVDHLAAFYSPLGSIYEGNYDGLIVTGAPVETMAFEEVDYWPELVRLLDWSKATLLSTLHICWGAQAGLYRHFGIGKHPLDSKMFGLFYHSPAVCSSPLLRGLDRSFLAPHSRHTGVSLDAVAAAEGLRLLAASERAGLYLASSEDGRMVFVTGHPEYDRLTLKGEYERDVAKGLAIEVPENYFPKGDPANEPPLSWREPAALLYANWLGTIAGDKASRTAPAALRQAAYYSGEEDRE